MKVRLVLAVACALLATAPAASATTTEVKILQVNICNSGLAGCYTGKAVDHAVSVIASARPQVLSVNESCVSDIEPLHKAMGPSAVAFVAARRPDGSPVLCTNGEQYGNIVMVLAELAGPVTATGLYATQDTSTEHRAWACLPAGKIGACTTHLSARSGSTALAQCKELMAKVVDHPRPAVVAGDMNLRYRGWPDVQSCNPPGFYRKGDGGLQHVFVSSDLKFVRGTRIDMNGTTDHPGWMVTVKMG
ncbi:endonuclease/exonuclease/phosphatase family protein [Kibdelosporangium phytohabitans]|uniref:Endonuclease/exonuclease/phosphatase domain-containing protein n=1 Tax=Kibdelosporangium phytohabitans TaxID=860235 RepID=A0A0N9I2X3_9PSEU|nr:endonuclease/exonuclease/phosphatase family protein [Kibdelosporangium phytohabitans]ALG08827.1 hypothetical protein AOZ06_19605 [Kibdelosporangium phytohabitans]MBE1470028.1 hypothetical protein [Kibdelosporangium phytohabitans]